MAKQPFFFDVDESAWKHNAATNAWFLHYFPEKQPDLNWETPAWRGAIQRHEILV